MPKLLTHTSGPQSVASTEKHISQEKPLAPSFSFQFSQSCNAAAAEKLFCYCLLPDDGSSMAGCDNENCVNQWYHPRCLKLKCRPKSKHWYCPECKVSRPSKLRKCLCYFLVGFCFRDFFWLNICCLIVLKILKILAN